MLTKKTVVIIASFLLGFLLFGLTNPIQTSSAPRVTVVAFYDYYQHLDPYDGSFLSTARAEEICKNQKLKLSGAGPARFLDFRIFAKTICNEHTAASGGIPPEGGECSVDPAAWKYDLIHSIELRHLVGSGKCVNTNDIEDSIAVYQQYVDSGTGGLVGICFQCKSDVPPPDTPPDTPPDNPPNTPPNTPPTPDCITNNTCLTPGDAANAPPPPGGTWNPGEPQPNCNDYGGFLYPNNPWGQGCAGGVANAANNHVVVKEWHKPNGELAYACYKCILGAPIPPPPSDKCQELCQSVTPQTLKDQCYARCALDAIPLCPGASCTVRAGQLNRPSPDNYTENSCPPNLEADSFSYRCLAPNPNPTSTQLYLTNTEKCYSCSDPSSLYTCPNIPGQACRLGNFSNRFFINPPPILSTQAYLQIQEGNLFSVPSINSLYVYLPGIGTCSPGQLCTKELPTQQNVMDFCQNNLNGASHHFYYSNTCPAGSRVLFTYLGTAGQCCTPPEPPPTVDTQISFTVNLDNSIKNDLSCFDPGDPQTWTADEFQIIISQEDSDCN